MLSTRTLIFLFLRPSPQASLTAMSTSPLSLQATKVCQHVRRVSILSNHLTGYVKTYIVLPPTIYGVPTGILHKHGLQRSLVSQVRVLVEASIARKQGGVVGEGKNHWPNVDVNESTSLFFISRVLFTTPAVVDLYLIIFNLALSPSSSPPNSSMVDLASTLLSVTSTACTIFPKPQLRGLPPRYRISRAHTFQQDGSGTFALCSGHQLTSRL